MQRSTTFIERFNSGDLLRIRPRVDGLITSKPDWESELRQLADGAMDEERRLLFYDVAVFANSFQEVATAFEHRTIQADYTWDVFGGLVKRYWTLLQPYIEANRKVCERPTLYNGFQRLAEKMGKLDRKKMRK